MSSYIRILDKSATFLKKFGFPVKVVLKSVHLLIKNRATRTSEPKYFFKFTHSVFSFICSEVNKTPKREDWILIG